MSFWCSINLKFALSHIFALSLNISHFQNGCNPDLGKKMHKSFLLFVLDKKHGLHTNEQVLQEYRGIYDAAVVQISVLTSLPRPLLFAVMVSPLISDSCLKTGVILPLPIQCSISKRVDFSLLFLHIFSPYQQCFSFSDRVKGPCERKSCAEMKPQVFIFDLRNFYLKGVQQNTSQFPQQQIPRC